MVLVGFGFRSNIGRFALLNKRSISSQNNFKINFMKTVVAILFFLGGISIALPAQKLKTIKQKTTDIIPTTIEYQVLKEDQSVWHGTYMETRGKGKLVEGQYVQNERSGVWTYYQYDNSVYYKYDYEQEKVVEVNPSLMDKPHVLVVDGEETEVDEVDHPVLVIGGTSQQLMKIYKGIRYPADARERGIQGTVVIEGTIEPDGRCHSIAIRKSLYPSMDQEALRMAKEALTATQYIPATKDGKAVAAKYFMPVKFKLH
jgi:protein TonB